MPKRKESARSKAARNAVDIGSGSYRPSAEVRRRREQEQEAKRLEEAIAEKRRLEYIEQLKAQLSGAKPKPGYKEYREAASAQQAQAEQPSQSPAKQERGEPTPKHGVMLCNQWLFFQYFDNSQTNLRELVEEWLRIRREQDYKEPPLKPLDSMRTAISEEKRRRGIGA